jgi:hypothetical protein
MTHAAAANKNANSDPPTDASKATVSTITFADFDQLFGKMKTYVADTPGNGGINIEELEAKIKKSSDEVQAARDHLSTTIFSISSRVDSLSEELKLQHSKLSDEIKRQNVIILGMQQQFQEGMADFSTKLKAIYTNQGDPALIISSPASTSKPRQGGEQDK